MNVLTATVLSTSLRAYTGPDVATFDVYHAETPAEVDWYFRYGIYAIDDLSFANPIMYGDTTTGASGLSSRLDIHGILGQIQPLPASGMYTNLEWIDRSFRAGILIVPFMKSQLDVMVEGQKYVFRCAQQRGDGTGPVTSNNWSQWHDKIVVW